MAEYLLVTTTTETEEEARGIAERLLRDRQAACVQILGPISSVYRWQGEVERAEEWLVLAKTTAERWPQVEAVITQMHSYQVPEIIALPLAAGSEAYLGWLRESVGG